MGNVSPEVAGRVSGRGRVGPLRVLGAIGIVALGLASCGDSGGASMEGASGGASITVQAFQFKPSPLEVGAGSEVVWTNDDAIGHTVTAGKPDNPEDLFDAPLDGKGATFRFRFEAAGTYRYFCSIHPSMLGEIQVTAT